MKILHLALAVILISATAAFAEENYPVRPYLINQLSGLQNELVKLGNDIVDFQEKEPAEQNFNLIAKNVISAYDYLKSLRTLLEVELLHGQAKQNNVKAINEIMDYIYDVNQQIITLLQDCTNIINTAKNPAVINYADKATQLISRAQELYSMASKELENTKKTEVFKSE